MKSSTLPNRKQIQNATSFGRYPRNYRTLIKKFLSNTLYDPNSAFCQFRKPYRGFVLLDGSHEAMMWGYIVDVEINVKNETGQYDGKRPYTFFFKYDSIRLIESFRVRARSYR